MLYPLINNPFHVMEMKFEYLLLNLLMNDKIRYNKNPVWKVNELTLMYNKRVNVRTLYRWAM